MGLWRHGSGELIDFAKWHTRCSCPSSSMPLFHALITDADLRGPSLHRRFSIANEGGLADFLDGRGARLAACGENLAVLAAGSVREDPLELLSRDRLRQFLGAAARPFRVVLADTPA